MASVIDGITEGRLTGIQRLVSYHRSPARRALLILLTITLLSGSMAAAAVADSVSLAQAQESPTANADPPGPPMSEPVTTSTTVAPVSPTTTEPAEPPPTTPPPAREPTPDGLVPLPAITTNDPARPSDMTGRLAPGAEEITAARTRDHKQFRNPDGTESTVFGRDLAYEAAPGDWQDVNLNFHPSGADDVMDQAQVIATVSDNGIAVANRSDGHGIRWFTPERPKVSGQFASFSSQGLDWQYATTPAGLKLSATVAARQGPRRYEFGYELLGEKATPLILAKDGDLVGDGFTVPRPSVTSQKGTPTDSGPWQLLTDGAVAFDFDDSKLPDESFPYVIDPTTTFNNAGAGDTWHITGYSGTYPPNSPSAAGTGASVGKDYLPVGGSNGRVSCGSSCYATTNMFLRWDTSSLPDNAHVTAASVYGQVGTVDNANNAILESSYPFPFPPPGSPFSGYLPTSGPPVQPPYYLSYLTPNALNGIGVLHYADTSLTGTTSLRYNINGEAVPTGSNGFTLGGTGYPSLVVTYNVSAGGPLANAVKADNPISYWPLDEFNGTVANDDMGHNDGTITGGVILGAQSAIQGTAMSFNGSTGFIDLAGKTGLQPTSALSVEAWFKTTATPSRAVLFRSRYRGYSLELRNGGLWGSVFDGSGASHDVASPYLSADGQWHHAVLTKDANNATLYLDGDVFVGTTPDNQAVSYSGSGIAIAKDGDCPCDYVNGAVDEVAVYDHALSPERVKAHMLGGLYGRATFGGGGPTECACHNPGAPVTTSTGNFWHTFDDVAIPGRGPGLHLSRTYNAGAGDTSGPFGWGWSSTYTMSAIIGPAGSVTIRQEAGDEVVFTPKVGGGYSSPNWLIATLVQNGDGTYTMTRRARERITFSATGKLLTIADLNGETVTMTYNAYGQLQSISQPGLGALNIGFGANGKIGSVLDAASRQFLYGYDTGGNLTDVWDPAGGNTHFTYDGAHRMLTMRDPRLGTLTNTYDTAGRVTLQVDAMNRSTSFDYTSTPGATRVTDPKGNITIDYYQRGLLVTQVRAAGWAEEATWRWAYDPATLKPTTITDPKNHSTTRTYDAAGNLLTNTDPLIHTTTFTYDALNDLKTVNDPNQVTTTLNYDGNGNLTSRSTPLVGTAAVQTTLFGHGDANHPGDVTSMTDPDNKVWTFAYDGAGRMNRATDPLTKATAYGYDAVGRPTSTVNARGTDAGVVPGCSPPALGCTTTAYAYDGSGEVVTTTDPLGHVSSRHYDLNRNIDRVTDADNHTTTSVYNADNELTQTNRADATHVTYDHDDTGNVTVQRDGANVPTSYGYDHLDRMVSTSDPLVRSTIFGYDKADNRTSVRDPQNRTTTFAYDNANRLTSVDYAGGAPNVTNITYDNDDQRTAMTDQTGTSTWTWDSLHRMTQSTPGSGPSVTYGYDLRNHLTTVTVAGAPTVTRGYDNAGRWTSVNDGRGHTTTFGYDPDSDLTTQSAPNGVNTVNTFDNADRLMGITHTRPGGATTTFGYGRDNANQLTSVASTGSPTPPAGDNHSFDYTALNQLKSDNSAPFRYDPADNLIRMANGNLQSFDVANELTSSAGAPGATAYGISTDKPVPADYDGDGKADIAIFRQSTGLWAIHNSRTDTDTFVTYGQNNDRAVPADYDGDAKADIAIYRPSTGTWYIHQSTNGADIAITYGGVSGDEPVPADYDGDHKADIAIFRAGLWLVHPSGGGPDTATAYGASGDKAQPVDFDGDGKADIAIFRDVTGLWAIHPSGGGLDTFMTYGILGDRAVAADYDGDAKADIAIFRPSAGGWYVHQSSNGTDTVTTFGISGDTEIPANYDGDARADFALFRPTGAIWYVRPTSTLNFGYDSNGNRASKTPLGGTASTYGYDQANRLTSAPGATFAYDGSGSRTSKANTSTGVTTSFTWDRSAPLPLLVGESTPTRSVTYIYGPGGLPVEQVEQVGPTTTVLYYQHDQLGSTRLLTDSGGGVAGSFNYDAYGNPTGSTGTATTPLGFAGEYRDAETGFQYLRARYYDPATGQFMSRDPISALTQQPFSYSDDNPLNLTDKSGLSTDSTCPSGLESCNQLPVHGGSLGSSSQAAEPPDRSCPLFSSRPECADDWLRDFGVLWGVIHIVEAADHIREACEGDPVCYALAAIIDLAAIFLASYYYYDRTRRDDCPTVPRHPTVHLPL